MKILALELLAVCLFFVGCSSTDYHLELTPQGTEIQRRLTIHFPTAPTPGSDSTSDTLKESLAADERVVRISKHYVKPMEIDDDGDPLFVGMFSGPLPADIGGAGSYTHLETSLGSLSVYVERSQGNDDIAEVVNDRNTKIDALVDLVDQWIVFASDNDESSDGLREVLNENVREDLKNVSLYVLAAESTETQETAKTSIARFAQYLIERDYFTIAELPKMVRIFSDDDPDQVARLFEGIVARKLESEQQKIAPEISLLLKNPKRLEESLRNFLRTTPQYELKVRQARESGEEVTLNSPDPMDVLSDSVWSVLFLGMSGLGNPIDVTLHADQKPFYFNGDWDEMEKTVKWSNHMHPESVPDLMYATWSQPNEAEQVARFGRVFLTDQKLAEYVQKYHGLTDQEAAQWDGFINSTDTDSNLLKKVPSFQFDGKSAFADSMVKLLADELKSDQ